MNESKHFDTISASIKTSKIPKFLNRTIRNLNVNHNNHNKQSIKQNQKFWQKFDTKNLKGKQSRIPVFKPIISIKDNNSVDEQKSVTNIKSDVFKSNGNHLLTKSESNVDFGVKYRSVVGRSSTAIGWTQSEPIDCLKYILEIVRSNSTADNKFRAIKRYRDKRLGIIHHMDSYSDDTFDDRVSQWVDSSGYISSHTKSNDVFDPNNSKCESTPKTANSMINQTDLISRRRSYNSMRAMDLIALNKKFHSFNSELSTSSISSIDSLLESRREDPEELLYALGFGYQPESQTLNNRIPQRFFESPSSARGVNPDNVRKMYGVKDIPSLSNSASFASTDLRERSYSCGRISERFQKGINSKESIAKSELPQIVTSSCSSLHQSESILNPANRRFLESQGKEEHHRLSSKRLIIGTKSYKLDIDGDPLAFPKSPSPSTTSPVPNDNKNENMDVTINEGNPNPSDYNDNNVSQIPKRNPFNRQNRISEQELNERMLKFSDSDMSSSTTTLVGTVVSGSYEIHNYSNDSFESNDKRNAFSQTDRQSAEGDGNKVIESALVVAIQSLRLSLEFYKHQSIRLSKIWSQKYNQSSNLTEEEVFNLSKIQELRENIDKEIVEMDIQLNRHLQTLHSTDVLDSSFIFQAQVFTEAIKKVRQLLKEQHNIYSQMGLIQPNKH